MTMATNAPSIVQGRSQSDDTIFIVLQDFGALGCAYRETDPDHADRESVIDGLIRGEFDRPLRVIAFNAVEGWARDVSDDVAAELRARSHCERIAFGAGIRAFIERAS